MPNQLSLNNAIAACNASYTGALIDGYTIVVGPIATDLGGNAVVYQRDGTNEFIVAFRGTDGAADVFSNVGVGREQWEQLWTDPDMSAFFAGALAAGHTLHFTGHSLGGALPGRLDALTGSIRASVVGRAARAVRPIAFLPVDIWCGATPRSV